MIRAILAFVLTLLAFPMMLGNPLEGDYIIISWNDLGMHCSNKDFSKIVILPPYNNIRAQVIKRGSSTTKPEIVTEGINVTYEFPGNTYSVGKTNFWDYEDQIFGVTLEPNIGLTGVGLSGTMTAESDHFAVNGVPLTPYTDDDLVNEDPYQQALIQLYSNNNLLGSANPVVPVSNEISCVSSGCHQSEQGILNHHEEEDGFDPTKTPILCAKCHGSNALGLPGNSEAGNLSFRIHSKHDEITDCYKCHPGPKTQCFRGAMFSAGKKCQDCHGSTANVGATARTSRRPWLDEPSCSDAGCHSTNYSPEQGKLFKDSKGHGGLFCSACHGSPHAVYPSTNSRDNEQMVSLQGNSGKLKDCAVCHGMVPNMPGPHGMIPSDVKTIKQTENSNSDIYKVYPNPSSGELTVPFRINKSGFVRIDVFDIKCRNVGSFIYETLSPGEYKSSVNLSYLPSGSYSMILNIANQPAARGTLVIKK